MRRIAVPLGVVALLLLSALLASPEATAQTLDELQHPLLAPGQVAVALDHNEFAFERHVIEIGTPPSSYFEPSYHALYPTIALGLAKSVQLTVDGTYLFPTLRSYELFSFPESRLDSHWLVKSLRTQMRVRPSDSVELGATYLVGRTRYDSSFPRGEGTSTNQSSHTDFLEVKGLWLSQPDRESRPRRADLDALGGPLLKRHRAKVDWEGLWRRYGSTQADDGPFVASSLDHVRSTDVRLRLGVGYGLRSGLELSGDGYWQPAFTVASSVVESPGSPARTDDRSRRLSAVSGARMSARWRPMARLEAFGETTWERQTVALGPDSTASRRNYHQRRLTTGATWLSRSPNGSANLRADLNGLYHPLLEKHQMRLDAVLHLRRSGADQVTADVEYTVWRAQAAVGIWSFLQAGVYAGRVHEGPAFRAFPFQDATSLGSTVTLRPGRQVEGYASFNYHPMAFIDDYPTFNLSRGSLFQSFDDFTDTQYEDDASLHVGVRFVF